MMTSTDFISCGHMPQIDDLCLLFLMQTMALEWLLLEAVGIYIYIYIYIRCCSVED